MSTDWNSSEPYAPPASSGGSSIWLWLGVGCALSLLLCCGGGGALMYFGVRRTVAPTQDPAEVAQRAREITDFDVPGGLKPAMAMSFNNPLNAEPFMTMVGYEQSEGEGGLFLMQMKEFGDPDQMKAQFDLQMAQQGKHAKHLKITESREVEVEIRGQPATFHIQDAEDINSKQKYIQVDGTFNGKGGIAMLRAQLGADQFSEDDAEKLVRSIK